MQYEQSIAHCIHFTYNFQTIYFIGIGFYWLSAYFISFLFGKLWAMDCATPVKFFNLSQAPRNSSKWIPDEVKDHSNSMAAKSNAPKPL